MDVSAPASENSGVTFSIPGRLAAACRSVPDRAAWLARLPDTLRDLERRWSLTIGVPFDGDDTTCAWVSPVTLATRPSAVLKVGMPHMEGEHEIDGLRFWNGDPTVRLLEADGDLGAMLLERCEPGTALRTLPEPEQDVVIAKLLRRLWRSPAAPHPFRPLSTMIAHWSDETMKASYVRVCASPRNWRTRRLHMCCWRRTFTLGTSFVRAGSRGS
jgi:streptomycin 6-kinase